MVSLNPELEQNVLIEVAKRMCIAARTAPKQTEKILGYRYTER